MDLEQRLRKLEKAVAGLEMRLAVLEGFLARGQAAPDAPAAPVGQASTAPAGKTGIRQFDLLMPLAVGCFVLAGAFLLRMFSQQGYFDMRTGAWAGLAYCLALQLGAGLLVQLPGPLAPMLSASAAVLAPALVLETYHRWQVLGIAEGVIGLAVLGLAGCWPALARRSRLLMFMCLSLPSLGIAGLGLGLEALGSRALGWAVLAAAALAGARLVKWPPLRPLVLLPALVFLAVAILATARRSGSAGGEFFNCALAAVLLLVAVLVNHLAGWRRLGSGEACWLPVVTTWLVALLGFARPAIVAPCGLAAGMTVLASGLVGGAWSSTGGRTAWRAMLAAGLVAALGGGLLSQAGLSSGAVALLVSLVAWKRGDAVVATLAVAATAVASVSGFTAGNLLSREGAAVSACLPGAALALVAIVQAWLFRSESARLLSPGFAAALVATAVLILTTRCLLVGLLAAGAVRTLLGSGLLGAATVGCLLVASRRQARNWQWLGFLLLLLLCGKVLLADLTYASGAVAALDAGILGTVLLLASIAKRKKNGPRPVGTDPG